MKKQTLFSNAHLEKLENREMPLDGWFATFEQNPVEIQVEKLKSKKTNIMAAKARYRIHIKDPFWPACQEATRTETDVTLLFRQLELRFPTAVVPGVPPDLKNKNLIEIFVQKVANNPFFRNDVAYYDFVDGLFKEYRMTKKKDRKFSEGTLRWLQCVTEHPPVNSDDQFIDCIKTDVDLVDKNHKAMLKSLNAIQDGLGKVEAATSEFGVALEGSLATERASEKKLPVSLCGAPPELLGNHFEDLINMTAKHKVALKRAYGAAAFKRILIDPITYEITILAAWKKAVASVKNKKRSYERAKEASEKDAEKTPALTEKKNERYVDYHTARNGILGFELERYKQSRTIFMQKFYEDFCKFQLRGANEILHEWMTSGVTFDPNSSENQVELSTNMDYANSVVSGKTSRSFAQNQNNKNLPNVESVAVESVKEGAETTVSLLVTASFSPRKRGHLKVTEGEILAGHRADNGLWYATNGNGKKGLVSPKYVAVRSKKDTHTLQRKKHESVVNSMPPGLNNFRQTNNNNTNINTNDTNKKATFVEMSASASQVISEAEDNENEQENENEPDDWSVSEEEEETEENLVKVAPTNRPKMSFQKPVETNNNNNNKRVSFEKPQIEKTAEKEKPLVPMKPQLPSLKLAPGLNFKKPSILEDSPTFSSTKISDNKSPVSKNRKESITDSVKPQTANKNFNDPGNKPVIPTFGISNNNNNAETANSNMGSSTVAPPKLNFLADIQKANVKKTLKKVPESEKSAEIGGTKNTEKNEKIEKSEKGKSGTGFGIMGELQAKLKKRI